MQTAPVIDGASERPDLSQEIDTLKFLPAPGQPSDRPLASLAVLLRDRPPVVVASTGGSVVAALAYRLLRRRSRLLIWSDAPAPPWRWLRRLALRLADGVLVRGEPEAGVALAVRGTDVVFEVPGPHETTVFLDGAPTRAGPDAYRLVVRSPLTPPSGVLRILDGVARAAERLPSRRIELHWIGEGDLRGVLAAQPLPDNLRQSFLGDLDRDDTARFFHRSGVLIAPFDPNDPVLFKARVAEAMASGLVVLFDRSHPAAGHVLADGETGIAFDARRPDGLARALLSVLSTSTGRLDLMRLAARRRALEMSPRDFAERLARAVETVTREGPGPGPCAAPRIRAPVLEAD